MRVIDLATLSISGFTNTVSGTAFSDNLTSGTNWTVNGGSATYSGSGATFTSNNTLLVSNGSTVSPTSTIPVEAKVTFTTPSTVPTNMKVVLYQDANNTYELRWQNDNNLVLYTTVAGTTTAPKASGGTPTESASTNYTFDLKLDGAGNLTATLSGGASASLTAVDTNLKGPFKIAIGGDANVIATSAQLIGPITTPASAIAEAKQPIWWSDGQYNGSGGPTTAGSFFFQDGGGNASSGTSSSTKLFTLSSTWSPSQKFAYEASFMSNNASYTVYEALWDFTTNSIVSGSQVSTSSTVASVIRSSQFTLIPGHSYGITTWGSSSSGYADNIDASLIIFPT